MARQTLSADEIRLEVEKLIYRSEEIREDGARIVVPHPEQLAQPGPDGCNWAMGFFGGDARSYPGPINLAIREAQALYNLPVGFAGGSAIKG